MVRCMAISDVRSREPSILLPSISQMMRSSTVIIPLLMLVHVHRILFASSRMLMLPSFAATQPFWYTSFPMSTISCRSSFSDFTIWKYDCSKQNSFSPASAASLRLVRQQAAGLPQGSGAPEAIGAVFPNSESPLHSILLKPRYPDGRHRIQRLIRVNRNQEIAIVQTVSRQSEVDLI